MITLTIRRAAKINTGNYENTDVGVELSMNIADNEATLDKDTGKMTTSTTNELIQAAAIKLMANVETILKQKIDDIELGKRDVSSKAKRYGL